MRIGTSESSDVIKLKVPKFSAGKCGTNAGRDGVRSILQRRTPSGAQGRNTWREEKLVDTNDATLKGLVRYLKGTDQKYRCLAERTHSHGIR